MKQGKLKDFWSMSWTQARGQVSQENADECRLALASSGVEIPDVTMGRLAAVFAAFMDGGPEPSATTP